MEKKSLLLLLAAVLATFIAWVFDFVGETDRFSVVPLKRGNFYFYKTRSGHLQNQVFTVHPKFIVWNCGTGRTDSLVSLVVQGSPDRLPFFPVLLKTWTGPIELVVFLDIFSDLRLFTIFLRHLSCELQSSRRDTCGLSLHLVVSSRWRHSFISFIRKRVTEALTTPLSCPVQLESTGDSPNGLFPANLLRNIGIRQVQTPFRLVLDADIILSKGAYSYLEMILRESDAKQWTAVVLPALELDAKLCFSGQPLNKSELLQLVEVGVAFPFYSHINPRVHRPTNFPRWYRLSCSESEAGLGLFAVDWEDPFEPFVVVRTDAPVYCPRFQGYGINRLSQLAELSMANFQFVVSDCAFALHCGYKTEDNTRTEWKLSQLHANQGLYKGEFAARLLREYGGVDTRA